MTQPTSTPGKMVEREPLAGVHHALNRSAAQRLDAWIIAELAKDELAAALQDDAA